MKRLFKFIGFILILNLAIGMGLVGYAVSYVLDCFEGSNVTIKNFINDEFSQEQYDIIMTNAKVKAEKAGEALKVLLEPKKFSDMPETEYPYPTIDEIFNEEWERNNQKAVKKGIDVLRESEDALDKARQEGLKLIEDAEIEYQRAKKESFKGTDTKDK